MHHAYHHCASMKLIAQNNGFLEAVPDGFGIAPSTAIFLEKGDTNDWKKKEIDQMCRKCVYLKGTVHTQRKDMEHFHEHRTNKKYKIYFV